MRLALALDTTPDEFLTGSIRYESDQWRGRCRNAAKHESHEA